MRNYWVISDTHWGHANIIRYCQRPFASVEEMDDAMVTYWNETVKSNDYVYHLGDVLSGKYRRDVDVAIKLLRSLNGHKRLVLGNHDDGKSQAFRVCFDEITMWRQYPSMGLLMTHCPAHESTLNAKWPRNVHGHVHEKDPPSPAHVNVSVERIDYRPINVEELRVR